MTIVEDLSCRKTPLCSWKCSNPSRPTKPQWHPLKVTCSYRTRFNSLRYGACELHCVLSPFVISFSTSLLQFNTIQGQFFQYDYSRSSLDSLPFSFASTCLLKSPNSNSLLILFVARLTGLTFQLSDYTLLLSVRKLTSSWWPWEEHGVKSGCQG